MRKCAVHEQVEPRQGHKECTGYFCQTCCVEQIRRQIERGEPVTRCGVPSHKRAAGVVNLGQQYRGPAAAAPAVVDLRDATRSITAISEHLAAGATAEAAPQLRRDDELLIRPATKHAMPNPDMWQKPDVGWIREHQEAAARAAVVVNHKKVAAETEFLQQSAVKVMIWHAVGFSIFLRVMPQTYLMSQVELSPIYLHLNMYIFPLFTVKHHPDLANILYPPSKAHAETWLASETGGHWESQSVNAVRTFEASGILLYRTLPNDLVGNRLEGCQGMAEATGEQDKALTCGAMTSGATGKRQRVAVVDETSKEVQVDAKKRRVSARAPHTPDRCAETIKRNLSNLAHRQTGTAIVHIIRLATTLIVRMVNL